MSKYLKHYYVESGNSNIYLTNTNQSLTGKSHPLISNLNVIFWCQDDREIDYCLSTCSDDVEINETEGLTSYTYESWTEEVEKWFEFKKQKEIEKIFKDYNQSISNILEYEKWYHPSEYSLFAQKYEHSLKVLEKETEEEALTVSEILKLESEYKQKPVKELAEEIKQKYLDFIRLQSSLTSERSQKINVLKSITLDKTNIESMLLSFTKI